VPVNELSLRKAFGVTLKKLRIEKSLSQQALADYSELDRSYVSGLENGKYQPTLFVLYKVAECLEIEPEQFLALVNEERKKK
jgi:transcriptional regulator with XRE-family HTH domain